MLASQNDIIYLVKHSQAGDMESFTILVQSHQREVWRFLLGLLGDSEDAGDLAQQVFIKAWLNISTLKNPSCFSAWLRQIARNLTYDHWRGRGKKVLVVSWEQLAENNAIEGVDGLEDSIVESELVKLTLTEMSRNLRQCLLLGVVNGFSHDEIARRVGISEASVGTYISSARRQFRNIYRRLQGEQEREDQPHGTFNMCLLHPARNINSRSLSR